jgi:hypothetical protein
MLDTPREETIVGLRDRAILSAQFAGRVSVAPDRRAYRHPIR